MAVWQFWVWQIEQPIRILKLNLIGQSFVFIFTRTFSCCLFVCLFSTGPAPIATSEPVYRDDGGTETAGRKELYAFPLSFFGLIPFIGLLWQFSPTEGATLHLTSPGRSALTTPFLLPVFIVARQPASLPRKVCGIWCGDPIHRPSNRLVSNDDQRQYGQTLRQ